MTVYPRLADSPWAGALAAAPQMVAQLTQVTLKNAVITQYVIALNKLGVCLSFYAVQTVETICRFEFGERSACWLHTVYCQSPHQRSDKQLRPPSIF